MRLRLLASTVVVAGLARCSTYGTEDALPPAVPDASSPLPTMVTTFAIDGLVLGDSTNGWASIGYDLDGKRTTEQSTDVCTLAQANMTSLQVDGFGGRDNSFGHWILPMVEDLSAPFCWACDAGPTPSISDVETQMVDQGRFTLQIQTTGLSGDPNQTAVGLAAQVFSSDAFDGTTPTFDSTTDWPVQPESLVDQSSIASGASAHFSSAYVTHGTFVAGTNEHVIVPLHAVINGFVFTLPIHEAIITFDHMDASTAANGVLAGLLDVAELTAIFQRQAGGISTTLCGSAFDGIAQQITEAADILADRTNRNGTPCTSISFGIAFHAKRVANPTKVAAPLTIVDPCALDGGIDGDASDASSE